MLAPLIALAAATQAVPAPAITPIKKDGFSDPKTYFWRSKLIVEYAISNRDQDVARLGLASGKIYVRPKVGVYSPSIPLNGANIRDLLGGCNREGKAEVDDSGATLTFRCVNAKLNGLYTVDFDFNGELLQNVWILTPEDRAKLDASAEKPNSQASTPEEVAAASRVIAQGAAPDEPVPSDPVVTNLIEDLQAGNSDAAVSRIRGVESLTGLPRLVTTSRQFVERMRGCKLASRKASGGPSFRIEKTEWTCADGAYEVAFVGEPGTPYVTVAEFSDPARVAERKARPVVPVAPPVITVPLTPEQRAAQDAEQARILETFGSAVGKGDLANMAAYIAPTTRFALGYRDVTNRTTVIEMDGDGIEEGQRQVDWVIGTFGRPTSTNCGREGVVARCLLRFAKPGSLLIFPGIWKGKVRNVQFLYVNEKVIRLNAATIQGASSK